MAYIQQQQQSSAGSGPAAGDQSELMTGTYEVRIDAKIGIPLATEIEQANNQHHQQQQQQTQIQLQQHQQPQQQPQQQQQQQPQQQQNSDDSRNANANQEANSANNIDNHNASPNGADNEDQSQNNDGNSSLRESLACPKTPNSYKYPLLKRYFEFGPWVGRNRKALCLACHTQSSSSQPDRLLKHLNRCNGLSEEDKAVVCELMNDRTANKRKRPCNVLNKKRDDDDSEYYAEDEQNASLSGDITHGCINSSNLSNNASAGGYTVKKLRRENMDRNSQIDEALTRFIINCRIPLKAIHSREFIELIRALSPDYQIPSRETITNVLIPGLLHII